MQVKPYRVTSFSRIFPNFPKKSNFVIRKEKDKYNKIFDI